MAEMVRPAIGRGLVSGFVGAVAMVLSQAIEQEITGRPGSDVPVRVAGKVFGARPRSSKDKKQLGFAMQWGHNLLAGAAWGLLASRGVGGARAAATLFALIWSGDAALYAVTGASPPPWKWKGQELATDLLHKGVLAVATSTVYDRIRGSQ